MLKGFFYSLLRSLQTAAKKNSFRRRFKLSECFLATTIIVVFIIDIFINVTEG